MRRPKVPAELRRAMPRNKDDREGAEALVALGYPAIAPILDEMILWLRQTGSPIFAPFVGLFATLGAPAIPVVARALASGDPSLIHTILTRVVSQWPRDAVAPLQAELERVVTGAEVAGANLETAALLLRWNLGDRHWIAGWLAFQSKRYADLVVRAREVSAGLEVATS